MPMIRTLALLALAAATLPLAGCSATSGATAPQSGYSYDPGRGPTLQNMDGEPRSYGDTIANQPAGKASADQR